MATAFPPPDTTQPRAERARRCPPPDRPARPPFPPGGRGPLPPGRPGPGRASRGRTAGRPRPGPAAEPLLDTPRRVAASYAELLTPTPFTLTTFSNHDGYDQLILARAIPFASLCQHHLLPFTGLAHLGYLPAEQILGLSKLARVVERFARRLQLQERLTTQIAGWLQDHLEPKGLGVVLEAEHQCMTLRGVRAAGTHTLTSTLHGLLRTDPHPRQQFLTLTGTAT